MGSNSSTRRIFFLCDETPALLPVFFDTILRNRPADWVVVGAAVQASLPPPAGGLPFHLRLGGYAVLPRLALRLARSTLRREPLSVRATLRRHGLSAQRIRSPNLPGFVDHVRSLKPDILYNAGSRRLLADLLSVPRLGCLNRHAGRLPDYRGVAPVWWAFFRGEASVTVCYHSMVEEIDGGTVLWEHQEPRRIGDTVVGMYDRLFRPAAECFWLVPSILEEDRGRTINARAGHYYSLPTPKQAREFRSRGLRYV